MSEWRCEVCRCGLDTANRRRTELGLPPVRVNQRACSPECIATRRLRVIRVLGGAAAVPRWRCEGCGIGWEAAQARRRVRGLPPLFNVRTRTCRPGCGRKARR